MAMARIGASSQMTNSLQDVIFDATRRSHARLVPAMNWSISAGRAYYSSFLRGQAERCFRSRPRWSAAASTICCRTGSSDGACRRWSTIWPRSTPASTRCPFPCSAGAKDHRAAEMLGLVYVLEGLRMGARVILSRLAEEPDTAIIGATAYLRHGFGRRLWPTFLTTLEPAARRGRIPPA